MTKRPYHEVQPVRKATEDSHARAAKGSYADHYTTEYIRRCREGKDEYLHPPGSVGAPPDSGGGGGLWGLLNALTGGS